MGELNTNIQTNEYKRIGGWLILLGIGLVLNIVINLMNNAEVFSQLFGANVTSDSGMKILLYYSLGETIFFFVLSTYLLIIFLMKKRYVPKVYIAYLVLNFADGIVYFTLEKIFLNKTFNTYLAIFVNIIVSTLWITYFIKSKRVKGTFTK